MIGLMLRIGSALWGSPSMIIHLRKVQGEGDNIWFIVLRDGQLPQDNIRIEYI